MVYMVPSIVDLKYIFTYSSLLSERTVFILLVVCLSTCTLNILNFSNAPSLNPMKQTEILIDKCLILRHNAQRNGNTQVLPIIPVLQFISPLLLIFMPLTMHLLFNSCRLLKLRGPCLLYEIKSKWFIANTLSLAPFSKTNLLLLFVACSL